MAGIQEMINYAKYLSEVKRTRTPGVAMATGLMRGAFPTPEEKYAMESQLLKLAEYRERVAALKEGRKRAEESYQETGEEVADAMKRLEVEEVKSTPTGKYVTYGKPPVAKPVKVAKPAMPKVPTWKQRQEFQSVASALLGGIAELKDRNKVITQTEARKYIIEQGYNTEDFSEYINLYPKEPKKKWPGIGKDVEATRAYIISQPGYERLKIRLSTGSVTTPGVLPKGEKADPEMERVITEMIREGWATDRTDAIRQIRAVQGE